MSILSIRSADIQTPEFANVPVNQTGSIGSTITFNCTVTGHPKPTITWTKDNDSHSMQSSPKAKIKIVDDKGLSQLVITGVTREDYGKYQSLCEMRSIAVLNSRDTDPYSPRILTYPDVPCSKTRDVSTACQESYSFRFGQRWSEGISIGILLSKGCR